MIRIHDIRLVSDDIAEADVTWGHHLEHRDWFRFESRVDSYLGVRVDKPAVPHEFSVSFGQWLWTISAAIDQVRDGQPIAFPLDITSCQKPGTQDETDTEKTSRALWLEVRRLQGQLLRPMPDEDHARIRAKIERLQRELQLLDLHGKGQ
jgi:hypothetical protein